MKKFNYMYVRPATYGNGFDVVGVGTYEKSSVLAGQDKICYVATFDTVEECEEKYPECKGSFHGEFTAPRNTFDHLPDEGDGW